MPHDLDQATILAICANDSAAAAKVARDAARLAMFDELVEALAQQRCCVCEWMLHENAPECSMCREDRALLARARELQ